MADADQVRVGIDGAVRTAPLGTTAPTNPTTAYAAGWVDLGYLSDAGIDEDQNDGWSEIRAWQNKAIVRRTLDMFEQTFKYTLIETTAAGLSLYHKNSLITTASAVSTLQVVPPAENLAAFGIDIIDGDFNMRIIIPKGEVTSVGTITYNGSDPIGYELTITSRESGVVDTNGMPVHVIKMSDDPAWVAA